MARRLALALVLALSGLAVMALAELPAWASPGRFHHVAVAATVTGNAIEQAGRGDGLVRLCALRLHYVVEGRGYDDVRHAQDGVRLWPDERRVGDLRPGDTLTAWIDPGHPESASLHEDRPLGNEPGQWLLGAALLVASLVVALRPARAKAGTR